MKTTNNKNSVFSTTAQQSHNTKSKQKSFFLAIARATIWTTQ